MGVSKMSKSKRYTTLPCGLKLRLNVETGSFNLVGDLGGNDNATVSLPNKIQLNIVASPKNLMALSAFFLARAREREALRDA